MFPRHVACINVVVLIPGDGISTSGESKLKHKNSEERDHCESDPSAGWLSGSGEVLSGNSRHVANCKVDSGRQPCECQKSTARLINGPAAQAFDLAGITNTVRCSVLRFFSEEPAL